MFFDNAAQPTTPGDLSPADCLRVAQSLLFHFGHRRDVYALKWISKAGRKGYSPACRNSWSRVAGCVRALRKEADKSLEGACRECAAKDLPALTQEVLLRHLLGGHSVGVYLIDPSTNTCAFAAIDLDDPNRHRGKSKARNSGGEEQLNLDRAPLPLGARIVDAAATLGLTALLEKSGGGGGSHVWVFFEQPTPAETARQLMGGLASMVDLAPKDYEIFPKQASVGEDGLGSLIALPFQGPEAVDENRSVFYDPDSLLPITPFWAALRTIPDARASQEEINAALEAMRKAKALPRKRNARASRSPVGATPKPSSYVKLASDAVERVFKGCVALRFIREGGGARHTLGHEERLALASVLRDLPGGRDVLHEILARCPGYDQATTDRHLNSLNHPPLRCDKLIEWEICAERCEAMTKRRAKSPISFAYRANNHHRKTQRRNGRRTRVERDRFSMVGNDPPQPQRGQASLRERFRERFGI